MPISIEQVKKAVVEAGLVTPEDFAKAEAEAAKQKAPIEDVLVEMGIVPDIYIGQLIADVIGVPYARLDVREIPDFLLQVVPERMARFTRAVVFGRDEDGNLKVAMSDPEDIETMHLIEKRSGARVKVHYATDASINTVLERYVNDLESSIRTVFSEVASAEDIGKGKVSKEQEGAAVRVVSLLIEYAYQHGASDVHIEPHESEVVVRYRVDGILHDVAKLPRDLSDLITTRLKVMSKMRTDQHFMAQDGKCQQVIGNERIDVRVSALPVMGGEKMVLRLLTEKGKQHNLEDLGFSEADLQKIHRQMQKTYGMILSTGPTGSGKTTTLYGIIKKLNTRDINISTIEDPIEYSIEGVSQIQVNPRAGLTFATGLRSIVRQDPDIVMVGEIRDEETAGIAVNAALTGHLVLSTLHTNDAATTLPRLSDMKVEPFLIASTVDTIIGQRLVRRICQRCIGSYTATPKDLDGRVPEVIIDKLFGKGSKRRDSLTLYRGKGCNRCAYSGYRGRVGIFEVLIVDDEIKELIMRNANAVEVSRKAIQNGMTTMLDDGLRKSMAALTSLDEILKTMGY